MSHTNCRTHEPGLQSNPQVVELIKLSDDLRRTKDSFMGAGSLPCWIAAQINQADPDDDLFVPRMLCAGLWVEVNGLVNGLAKRAARHIPDQRVKSDVASALRRLHGRLKVPALTAIMKMHGYNKRGGRKEPAALDFEAIRDTKTVRAWISDVLQACCDAEPELPGLLLLSDEVYFLANHVREKEHAMAALARIHQGTQAIEATSTAARLKPRMPTTKANEKAKMLAEKYGRGFFALSGRKIAELIGCSWQTWTNTELYTKAKAKGRIKPPLRSTPPKARPLPADLTEQAKDKLIAESRADDRKTICYKQA
jgi:hypothetical protein